MNCNFERAENLLEILTDFSEGRKPIPLKFIDKQMHDKKKQEGWFSCPANYLADLLKTTRPAINASSDYLIREGYIKKERGGRCGNHWLVL